MTEQEARKVIQAFNVVLHSFEWLTEYESVVMREYNKDKDEYSFRVYLYNSPLYKSFRFDIDGVNKTWCSENFKYIFLDNFERRKEYGETNIELAVQSKN